MSLRLFAFLWLGSSLVLAESTRAELPEVVVQVDTARVTLGDPIQLTLRLRFRQEEQPWLPSLPSSWLQGFSVRPGGQEGPKEVDGGREVVQHLELRLYELGRRQIPPLAVAFVQASGDTLWRTSRPVEIEAVSVRTPQDTALRDIKPPVEIPGGLPLWLAVLLASMALAGGGGLLYGIWRRRRRSEIPPPPPEPMDYAAEFVRIANLGLVEKGDFKTYYSLLADNLRQYLEQSLGVEAMERTTSELSASLVGIELDREIAGQIEDYLRFADLVKFARLLPQLDRARRAPEAGIAIVRAVDRWKQEREALAPVELEVSAQPRAGES